MTHTHNTDHMFREAAGRYREKPPGEAWNAISGAVNSRSRKGLFIAVASVAAVVILLLGFAIGYFAGTMKDIPPGFTAVTEMPAVNDMQPVTNEIENYNIVLTESVEVFDEETIAAEQTKEIIKPSSSQESDIPQQMIESVDEIATTMEDVDKEYPVEPVDKSIASYVAGFEEADDMELSRVEKDAMLQQMMTATTNDMTSSVLYADKGSQHNPQPANTIARDRSGWSVGGDIAAAYAYRSIQQQELVYKDRSPIADESAVPSWNAGVYASKTIAGALHVKTGVTYASYGQGSQNLYAYADGKSFRVNSSSGNISTGLSEEYDASKPLSNTSIYNAPEYILLDNSEVLADVSLSDPDLQVIQRFDYMEIPLIFQLSGTSTKGISITAEGGLYAGILTSNRAYLATMEESYLIGKTENLRPFSFGGIASAGARYSFSPSLSAEIMPEIRYAFMSISKASDINYHPYQFGFGVGVTYHF